ncbi:MAG: alpha/beta fold hydrolase [Parafilimonas sp.]
MKKLITCSLVFFLAFIFITGCTDDYVTNPAEPKNTFVLIHGAWQAPFVWNDVEAKLVAAGYKVVVVELPAHGDDTTSPANVTMDIYRDKVVDAINKIDGKVILVGHSMGGVVITETAEAIPNKIDKLIYIGAFLPANGQSLLDLANMDAQSLLGPALIPADGGLTLDIIKDSITTIFCEDGTAAQQQLVLDNFKPEPAIPFGNAVTITAANFGSVDKYYIHTALDNAVGIDLQNRMAAAANITKEYSLNTGHCPFITNADATSQLLLQIANN